jgi:pilus assembly protein FimV
MVRMFKSLLTITCIVFAGTAYGLGLGEITLKSALNQPLLAEIELLQEEGMSPGEILPTLASQDDFRRAGILREFFLSNLQFKLVTGGNGQLVMLVTTKDPVQEPFLNFMLEVNWPTGRLLKEFTLLLDPPLFDQASLVSFSAPVETPVAVVEQPKTTTVVETQSTTVKKAVPVRQEAIEENEYRVQQNDTLWQIALRVRKDKSLSPHQIMLAIQQMNPDAFINNNINRIKEGSLLVVPTTDQVKNWGLAEAVNEVGRQNKSLTGSAATTTASVSAVAPNGSVATDSAVQNPEGYLEVVSGAETGKGAASSGSLSDQSRKLSAELTTALELNDQLARENSELKSRLDALQDQLTILQNMVALQSETGVALANQAALAETHDATEADADHTAVEGDADHMAAEADHAAVEGDADHMAAEADHAAVEGDADHMVADTAHADATAVDEHDAAPHGHDPEPQSFISYLWTDVQKLLLGSLMNLALVGAAILLIIALIVMAVVKRRGSKGEAVPKVSDDNDDDFDIDGLGLDEDFGDETDDHDALASTGDSIVGLNQNDSQGTHADTVAEADIYIAYGRYDQAEDLLKAALVEDSSREDVKLKLAEVYVETGNAAGFNKLDAELKNGSSHVQQALNDLRSQLPAAGGVAEPEGLSPADFDLDSLPDDLDNLEDIPDTTASKKQSDSMASEDDFDMDDGLSFEDWDSEKTGFDMDDDLLLDADDPQDGATTGSERAAEPDDGSITFDLGSDNAPVITESDSKLEAPDTGDDNSLDFSFSEPSETQPETATAADDEGGMNFDFDEDLLLSTDGSDQETMPDGVDLDTDAEPSQAQPKTATAADDEGGINFDFDEDLLLSTDGSDQETMPEGVDLDADTEALVPGETSASDVDDDFLTDVEADDPFGESPGSDRATSDEALDDALGFNLDDDFDSLMPTGEQPATEVSDDAALMDALDLDDGSVDFETALADLGDFDSELAAVEDDSVAALKDVNVLSADSDDSANDLPMFADDNFDLGDLEDLNADLEGMSADDDFDLADGSDEISTKLDLARAYIDMDEKEGAKEILQEVMTEGSAEQIRKAEEMLVQLK